MTYILTGSQPPDALAEISTHQQARTAFESHDAFVGAMRQSGITARRTARRRS